MQCRKHEHATQVSKLEWWVVRILPVAMIAGLAIVAAWVIRNRGPSRNEFVRQTVSSFESANSPEDAESRIENAGTLRLLSGEWVTGVGVDGHSWKPAKDTLVVKDSRGQVKVFVGHYCGLNWMPRYFGGDYPKFCPDLDAFYTFLADWGFKPLE
jgi:hypothetical protein